MYKRQGMTYEQIGELADDSSADADNSSDESYSEKYAKQMLSLIHISQQAQTLLELNNRKPSEMLL